MARLINGILGSCSGVIGTIEGNSTKYGSVIKQRKNVAAQSSRSVKTPQRLAYVNTHALWLNLPDLWKNTFLFDKGNQLSKWNRFVHLNIINVKNTVFPYYTNLILSFSELPSCDYNVVFQRSSKRFYIQRLTPVDDSIYFNSNDVVYILLLDGFGRLVSSAQGWFRSTDQFYLMVPWFSAGQYPFLNMYIALANANGNYFFHISKFFQS